MRAAAFSREPSASERHADAALLVQLHLLLAFILLVRFIAAADGATASPVAHALSAAFVLYSITLLLLGRRALPPRLERVMLLADLVWISAMIHTSGGGTSPLFPFYVFTVILAAFRFGRDAALGATLAATLLYGLAALAHASALDPVRVGTRAIFLLSLGVMVANLGEANLRQQRRLALLRDVLGFANPRFGVDHTVANIMERCRLHFGADACLLVARRARSQHYELRIAGQRAPQILPADNPLCLAGQAGIVLFRGAMLPWLGGRASLQRLDADGRWHTAAGADGEPLAALCNARSFISVPLTFRGGAVRVNLCTGARHFDRADALFLEHVIAQVLPAIENVYLLDRMASLAALRERRAIGHDLHDSAVQPYIGLNTMLAALRRKAGADNPLRADIEELAAMSAQVVDDLRQFAHTFRRGGARGAGALIDAPLRRQLLRAKQWYDVDVRLELHGAAGMGDRLSAAVLQLAHEGISNICKHTDARRARLCICCDQTGVHLDIENESAQPACAFVPRSITARASALGGSTAVRHLTGATVVHIEIPA